MYPPDKPVLSKIVNTKCGGDCFVTSTVIGELSLTAAFSAVNASIV